MSLLICLTSSPCTDLHHCRSESTSDSCAIGTLKMLQSSFVMSSYFGVGSVSRMSRDCSVLMRAISSRECMVPRYSCCNLILGDDALLRWCSASSYPFANGLETLPAKGDVLVETDAGSIAVSLSMPLLLVRCCFGCASCCCWWTSCLSDCCSMARPGGCCACNAECCASRLSSLGCSITALSLCEKCNCAVLASSRRLHCVCDILRSMMAGP